LAHEQDYQNAYDLALRHTDDIYLLRLMMQTGPVTPHLRTETGKQVLQRINRVSRSGTLLRLELEWLEDAGRARTFDDMSRVEQNEYLDTLYQIVQLQ